MVGLVEAFWAFEAKGKNPYSWSARTPDGRVVLTFWQDQFRGQPLSYSNFESPDLSNWQIQPRNRERLRDLQWAQDHWDRRVGVVIVRAVDENEHPRSIKPKSANPRKDLLMQFHDLNVQTGEFRAINIGRWDQLRYLPAPGAPTRRRSSIHGAELRSGPP